MFSSRSLNGLCRGDESLRTRAKLVVDARFTIIIAASLWSPAAAWAGGGGAASAAIQSVLNTACTSAGIASANCPQLPTLNQIVVETAAIDGATPAAERLSRFSIPPGRAVDAGSASGLSNPLAFIASPGLPTPTQPNNPAANSFLSATTTPTTASPTTLNLTFDYHPRTLGFMPGQEGLNVGNIFLPLVVADASGNANPSDLSMPHLATLQIFADPNTCRTCLTTDIMANLTGSSLTYQLSQLGITFSNDNSNPNTGNFSSNEKFTVGIPLLIPATLRPAYTFSASGFEFDLTRGLFDGIDPVANFLDANFLDDANNLLAAAHADLAIAKNGRTILSDPIPTATPEPTTLALLGGGLVGLALLRRRRGLTQGGRPEGTE